MKKKQIVILQGHPDPDGQHFGYALAEAYAHAAREAGHEIQLVEVAKLDFPLLRTKADFDHGTPPAAVQQVQQAILWANHLALFYPLWLGAMPALLKGLLEQVFRPDFVNAGGELGLGGQRPLQGKSARVVVTMGMPALIYRWFYGAHGLKNLERNILGFCGFAPVKHSLIGLIEAEDASGRTKWLRKMEALGHAGK